MGRRAMVIAAAIPVLGIAALIGRAEVKVRSGAEWLIGIEGYDPRDLLSGRFLRYQYAFAWEGTDTCGEPPPAHEDGWPPPGSRGRSPAPPEAEQCCVCLSGRGGGRIEPAARLASCEEAEACEGSLRVSEVAGPRKYFVPEDRATDLDVAIRGRSAAVLLSLRRGSAPAVKELYLDGRPWREAFTDATRARP